MSSFNKVTLEKYIYNEETTQYSPFTHALTSLKGKLGGIVTSNRF